MKTKWQGRRFVIESFYPFVEQVRQIMKRENLLHLREGYQNAAESRNVAVEKEKGGTREPLSVRIFPSRSSSTCIQDNGFGMTKEKLLSNFQGVGSGEKAMEGGNNWRTGFKLVAPIFSPGGVRITSWTTPHLGAFQITLGSINDNPYDFGYVPYDEGNFVKNVSYPKNSGRSGTLVDITDLEYDQASFVRYLNSRYLTFTNEVMVDPDPDSKGKPIRLTGLLPELNRLCKESGIVRLDSCDLHWGIRKENPEHAEKNGLDLCLALAWDNEVYTRVSPASGERSLANWGIRTGHRQIILVVVAKGDGVQSSMFRDKIENWDIEEAQREVEKNLPPELERFMEEFELANYNRPGAVQEMGGEVLTVFQKLFGLSSVAKKNHAIDRDHTPSKNPVRGGRRKNEDENENEGEGRTPSKRRPSFTFVGNNVLGEGVGCSFNISNHEIEINEDYPSVTELLAMGKNAKERAKIMALIGAETTARFMADYSNNKDGIFPGPNLVSTYANAPTLAWVFVAKKHLKIMK